jgi:hypothetical protein
MIIVYILQYFITVTLSHMNAIVFYPKYNDISTVLTDYVAFVKYSIGYYKEQYRADAEDECSK